MSNNVSYLREQIEKVFDIKKLQRRVEEEAYKILEGITEVDNVQVEEIMESSWGSYIPEKVSELFQFELPPKEDDWYYEEFSDQESHMTDAINELIHVPTGFCLTFGSYDADCSWGLNLTKVEEE